MPRLFPAVLLVLLAAAPVAAVEFVEAEALFNGRAVLRVDGTRHMLRAGETSPEGVRLVSADSGRAVIEVAGERRTLDLSRRMSSRFRDRGERREVQIPADRRGQYQVRGTLNGHLVTFLVDTGASVVALSGRQAEQLGIAYRDVGRIGTVSTANGVAVSHSLTLDTIEVGALRAEGVAAVVVEGDYPQLPLLGMSFLRTVGLEQRDGLLVLHRRD